MGQLRIEYGAYGAARGVLGGQVAAFEADPGGAVTLSVTATPTDAGLQPVIAAAIGPDSLFVSLTALDVPIYVDIAATPDPTTEPRWLVMPGRPLRVHAGAGSRIAAVLAADVAAANPMPVAVANGSDVAQGSTGDAAYAGSGSATLVGLLKGLYTALIAPTPAGTNNIGIVTPLDGTRPNGAIGYSLSAVGTFFTQDVTGYSSISVQITALAASSTVVAESSNDDGTTWTSQSGVSANSTGASPDVTSITGTGLYVFANQGKQFRLRQLIYGGTGISTAVPVLKTAPAAPRSSAVANVPSTTVNATATSGGLSAVAKLASSGATTNAANIKSTAGRMLVVTGYVAAASVRWLKLYNKATSPVPGTDTPVFSIPLPPGPIALNLLPIGYYFSSGISYAVTANAADNDNTVIAVGDILQLDFHYI